MQDNEHDETVPMMSQDTIGSGAVNRAYRSKDSHNGLDNRLRLKFAQMDEQSQHVIQAMARIEATTATSQLQLHEQLADIRASITALTEVTINIQQLRADIEIERREHDVFKNKESSLERSIATLSSHITDLQESNKRVKHINLLLNTNILFLILFSILVFSHVFFG